MLSQKLPQPGGFLLPALLFLFQRGTAALQRREYFRMLLLQLTVLSQKLLQPGGFLLPALLFLFQRGAAALQCRECFRMLLL